MFIVVAGRTTTVVVERMSVANLFLNNFVKKCKFSLVG